MSTIASKVASRRSRRTAGQEPETTPAVDAQGFTISPSKAAKKQKKKPSAPGAFPDKENDPSSSESESTMSDDEKDFSYPKIDKLDGKETWVPWSKLMEIILKGEGLLSYITIKDYEAADRDKSKRKAAKCKAIIFRNIKYH